MKKLTIVHMSYAWVSGYTDPVSWLKRIDFFVDLTLAMSKFTIVKSYHCIAYDGTEKKGDVMFHFFNVGKFGTVLPMRIHSSLRELNPDAVIVHGLIFPLQLILLRRALGSRVKIVVQHHAEQPSRFIRAYVQRMADRCVDAYFFAAQALAKSWIDARQIKDRSKVYEVLAVSSIFHTTGNDDPSRTNTYLWVGRLDENKDPLTLMEGFGKFSDDVTTARLTMIYRGGQLLHEVTQFLEKNKNWKERITIKENVPHEDLGSWYNDAGFILSTSHYESSGAAVCEGMSCGCIPIVTNIPSFQLMTANGKVGFLFTPGDAAGLTKALSESTRIDQAAYRKEVLHHYADHLSNDAVASRIVNIIEKLV